MGALTLKSFPYELRGWDIESFESIDPTDSFGYSTRVYTNKNKIVQIEPDYNSYASNIWLTDKGRQFFDGIFDTRYIHTNDFSIDSLSNIIKDLIEILYIFDHCNKHNSKTYFFTIVFEYLSLEILTILYLISQNYSFLTIKRAENFKINNDLESYFQLNLYSKKNHLDLSSLCLLLSTNTRYEGYSLNLKLRQRFAKGNFKCLVIGSLINLTFPVSFLGSNFKIIETILQGTNLNCRELKCLNNSILIFNNEFFKRNNSFNTIEILKKLHSLTIFTKTFNSFNILNCSLSETGFHTLAKFSTLTGQDLNNFSTLYFLNINPDNISNLKKIAESKLLNYNLTKNYIPTLFFNQNKKQNKSVFFSKYFNNFNKEIFLPNSNFYANEGTFVSTDGLIKRTTKITFSKETTNNWQILRKFLFNFKKSVVFLDKKNNDIIFFNSNALVDFKNFMNFQYYAAHSLTNLNFYLNIKTKSFILYQKHTSFKLKTIKLINTKLKYWLDDFFNGGKDEYSKNSLILTNCSKLIRSRSSNFF
uniref:NADH dehydrogenase subunit 11 part b n=1 Tax=Amicula sp. isolate GU52X-4 cfCalB7 TaxID=3003489 RepID=A0A9E8Z1T6_9STRA|nr:NADH dehydrogenase subunit 11 part b [Amicula sp. isolate GU52X-4 cfCalB7]